MTKKKTESLQEYIERLLNDGEKDFKESIDAYPYKVFVETVGVAYEKEGEDRLIDLCNEIEKWCKENIETQCWVLPTEAIGKYKHMWQYVYFVDEEDAIRFKLVWG